MTSNGMRYRPADFRRVYVDDSRRLEAMTRELTHRDAVGVDLEMGQRQLRLPGGLQRWIHITALIQLASDDLSIVVDAVKCKDLSPLQDLFAGAAIKVFLGGGQDAALLVKENIPPVHVVDVGEIALGVFGRREDGMAALAKRIFGLTLDKTVRRTDWMVRPLNGGLVNYAHRDAELTLLIYRWFQIHFPAEVAEHVRLHLEPGVPLSAPPWLREALTRSAQDLPVILAEFNVDPDADKDRLAQDIRAALAESTAPRQCGRLVRVAGELHLTALIPDITHLASSSSSITRAAVARSLGHVGDPDAVRPVLLSLQTDPIEDVRKAAENAIRDIETPEPPAEDNTEPDEAETGLDEESQAILRQLMESLEPPED